MLTRSPDCDRFIPSRFHKGEVSSFEQPSSWTPYEQLIKQNLCPVSRTLGFSQSDKDKQNALNPNLFGNSIYANYCGFGISQSSTMACSSQGSGYQVEHPQHSSAERKQLKGLKTEAEKVLDAPGVRDDFYLSVMDWSKLGPLAIALDNQVYLYTPQNIMEVCKILDGSYVSSVKFCAGNPLLAVGYSDGKARIYDMQKFSLVRELNNHEKRISAMEFPSGVCSSISENLLYTGSKDRRIFLNDLHLRNPVVTQYTGHRGQICSLKIDPNQPTCLASGSNDNTVRIWDSRREKDQQILRNNQHKGAVKAIDWCPWKSGVIATAGGSGDRSIRVWSARCQQSFCIKKTQTQISSLLWNRSLNCLFSSHGCPKNELISWKTALNGSTALTLTHNKTLKGHTGRILQTVKSPNQGLLCSISADETIRFWRAHDMGDAWSSSVESSYFQEQEEEDFSSSGRSHCSNSNNNSRMGGWSMRIK